ncbi:MAG TPA: SCO family protein [Ktedonobacteraceae bacterium]|nr:SCO family protein [Ktedonobacteraceae bacterium]
MNINWRLASRLSVVTLALLVVVLVTLLQHHYSSTPTLPGNTGANNTSASGLQGVDLGGQAAPDFRLTDQFGQQVALSQFKGKPIVLTFLYTSCPDQCPLTAEKLHTVMQSLGADAQKVAVISVSTDPKRDTVAAALDFSRKHSMQDYWHYLVGTQDTLSPIWNDYNVYVQSQQQTVNHGLGLYVIDKQGNERVFMDNDFTPAQLTANLKTLLKG